ncbi:inositol monophosphatase family protein [Pseudomonas resinovorans]|uniref:inositol monophosphatase family protein n=1 Tax=Metapseudomonas resinovorans TaxID=53412 RepID=UPI00237EE9FC|nr:inositol monophosphatase family protein [Pseudomonas resinovorans]MDE3739394.1 inositol monophosphatase family protein [Pseudomonas resinovorans]
MGYEGLLHHLIGIVLEAGELLVAESRRPGGPRRHGDKAEVDVEIETQLRLELLAFLDCDFWGEETGHRLSGQEFCWVVDPNDGTGDFLAGRVGSAVSVGLLRNAIPVLGVVYAPLTVDRGADCITWAEGMSAIVRNGQPVSSRLDQRALQAGSRVMVSTAATRQAELNALLCSPGDFLPMPSIAYRLARVAAGDGVAAVSIVPVAAHDVAAGHALLRGAGGVLINQDGEPVIYSSEASLALVSQRCFGGASAACHELAKRDWDQVFR